MASQQKVQNYLDRHRISALFEDLMARLIKNTPTEPIPYLIKILQKFDEKAKKPFQENPLATKKAPSPALSKTTPAPRVRPKDPLSKSTTSLKKDPLSKSTGHLSRSTSNLAKESPGATKGAGATSPGASYSWQPSSLPGVYGVDRGYERPWIANMKKIKYEQSLLRARKLHKSSSTGDGEGSIKSTPSSEADAEVQVEQIFDSLPDKPPPKPVFSNPASQAWVEAEPQPYRPPPPKPYQPAEQVEEAFLAEELSADKLSKRPDADGDGDKTDKPQIVVKDKRRVKAGNKSKKHKEELAALVDAQRQVETLGYLDSGGEAMDPDQGGYEEATDMLEDASDLMDEGITNVKSTGQKTRRKPSPPVAQVKVGVCSRCANVMAGGDTASTTGGGFTKGYGAYTSIDSSSEISHSSSSDFESASQVSGPRPMAWEGTTVDDARPLTTGTTRSMVHDQASELFKSSTKYSMKSSTEVRSSQRWESSSYTSEVERHASGAESLLERGRSWQQPGSDDDSSV